MLWKYAAVRIEPLYQVENWYRDTTPGFRSRSKRSSIAPPTRSMPRITCESMLGLNGSGNGGTNIRGGGHPAWCWLYMICGSQSLYSSVLTMRVSACVCM